MLRFECDEKGASTGICSGIELLEAAARDHLTLSAAFLVCCVAAGSALCACIDRVGLKGSPSTLRLSPQSQRKSRRVESAGLLVPTRSSSEAAATSGCGTFETCRRTLRMSAYGGRPEESGTQSKRRF